MRATIAAASDAGRLYAQQPSDEASAEFSQAIARLYEFAESRCGARIDGAERCERQAGHAGDHRHADARSFIEWDDFGNQSCGPLAAAPSEAAPPRATTPEPMTEERLAAIRTVAKALAHRDPVNGPLMIALVCEVDRLRASSPSRESGALLDFTAMVRRVANSRTGFRESPAAAELLAAIAALAGSPSRVSDVDQANLARLDAIREEMFAVGAENDELRSRLATLERDAARMREAAETNERLFLAENERANRLAREVQRSRKTMTEAADELENDPKTRTCYNVAAALRYTLALTPSGEPTTTPETNE